MHKSVNYSSFNHNTKREIIKTVKKFEETRHHCNVRTTENIAFVRENEADNPNLSIPKG